MDIAMMQPTFLPWQGYFELIYNSDIFVFLDDFQFSVQSFHQRNRLFSNKGQADWYSLPVKKSESFKAPINQAIINDSIPWRKKMWKRIVQNYGKSPYFDEIASFIKDWLFTMYETVAAQNIPFIQLVCRLLNIEREFRYSSQYPSDARRSERILELIRWCKGDRYFSAKGSFRYMLEDGVFPVQGVEVFFQDFRPKSYQQIGSNEGFKPYLSVLDALFNVGPGVTAELVKNGSPRMLSWDLMLSRAQSFQENAS